MKIICISDAWLPQINGVVRTYQNLGRALETMGHDFTVIGPGDFRFTLPAPTYPEIRLAVLARWTLPAKLRQMEFDAVHIATEGPLGRAARAYCLKRGIPFTTCYHTQFPEYLARRVPVLKNFIKNLAVGSLRAFHAKSSRIMVVSRSLEDHLREQGHSGPFHLLTRGVDADVFHPGAKPYFRGLKSPVALYVGRVAIEKNIELFLDAPWHGGKAVVGNGPALEALKSRYPDVCFTGPRTGPDLAAHYRSGDVFAFPSQTETFGVVLIEALACGLPVAAFPVMGPRDVVTDATLGALDDDFGSALQKAALSPGTAQDRAAHVAAHYGWDVAARQFLDGLALK